MPKMAVVLFNLGGPDSPEAVRPFLFNLFDDPAIIALPGLFRRPIAALISRRRAPIAREIYARMGGRSPLLPNTEAQARALENELGPDYRCFIAMRYWRPLTDAAAREAASWRPDRIVLLPLYPQFSTTTTASSLAVWRRAAKAAGIAAPTTTVCCYPEEGGFIETIAAEVRGALADAGTPRPRVLFSAHGLPEKIVRGGDPYQWQVERTVAAVVAAIAEPTLDYTICYQSRVGPLAWLGPATDAEIRRAGVGGVPLIVVPVAFVSEHSETLVELDIEYRHVADRAGVPSYRRLPTVGDSAPFVRGLAARVREAAASGTPLCSGEGGRICPAAFGRCAFAAGAP